MDVANKFSIFYRHYTLTVVILLIIAGSILAKFVFHLDLFDVVITELDNMQYIKTEEVIFSILLVGGSFLIDQFRLLRRTRRKRASETERLVVVRSTLASVHDVVNNSLNSFLLVKMDAENGQPMSREMLSLFGTLIEGLASELRSISEIDIVSKRDLSRGISVLDMRNK